MSKRITVLEFGGTIAMAPNAMGALAPAKSLRDVFASESELSQMANITLEQLRNEDSTNIHPADWIELAKRITEVTPHSDAIIITHGTDTMAYTAGALSLALGRGLNIPVILTGSQRSMMEYGSDARINLEHAVETALKAAEMDIAEVMIVFGHRVLRGNRAVKVSEARFLAFDSPAYPDIANLTAGGVSFMPGVMRANPSVKFKLAADFKTNILSIDPTPGLDPQILMKILRSGDCAGLILRAHGTGNVPSEGNYSLIPVIEEATHKLGIPVLITTKFLGGSTQLDSYEPGQLAHAAGAIPTGDLTDIMVQVKLMWALAQGHTSPIKLSEIINTNLVGEITT